MMRCRPVGRHPRRHHRRGRDATRADSTAEAPGASGRSWSWRSPPSRCARDVGILTFARAAAL